MANTASALKRVRQTETRTAHNRAVKSSLKTSRKALATAIAGGKADEVTAALSAYSAKADKAAKVGVIHRNAAARLKSNATSATKAPAKSAPAKK